MNFWRNGEVKKWGFINLLIVAAAVVVTYILSERNVKVALVTCIAGVVQFSLNIFFTKRRMGDCRNFKNNVNQQVKQECLE